MNMADHSLNAVLSNDENTMVIIPSMNTKNN